MKLLIVDDSKAMRMIVWRTLTQAELGGAVEIDEAENGAVALEKIVGGGYDLVFCDWNMPEMNGIELLKALRAQGDQTRFGFVTSESQPNMKDEALDAGALFLITKPFTPEAFSQILARVF